MQWMRLIMFSLAKRMSEILTSMGAGHCSCGRAAMGCRRAAATHQMLRTTLLTRHVLHLAADGCGEQRRLAAAAAHAVGHPRNEPRQLNVGLEVVGGRQCRQLGQFRTPWHLWQQTKQKRKRTAPIAARYLENASPAAALVGTLMCIT